MFGPSRMSQRRNAIFHSNALRSFCKAMECSASSGRNFTTWLACPATCNAILWSVNGGTVMSWHVQAEAGMHRMMAKPGGKRRGR
jgi:hypothetical protein